MPKTIEELAIGLKLFEDLYDLEDAELVTVWRNLDLLPLSENKDFQCTLAAMSVDRGEITFDPSRMTPEASMILVNYLVSTVTRGVYLSSPYAKQIATGEQTAILKGRAFYPLKHFNILVSKDQAFGFVRFYAEELLDKAQLDDRAAEHLIKPEQIEKWWPDRDAIFFYAVRDFIPFPEVRKIEPMEGAQVFVENVKIEKAESTEPLGAQTRLRWDCSFLPLAKIEKGEAEQRFVLGAVLQPDVADQHGDVCDEVEIRKAAHGFMLACQQIGIEHRMENPALRPVESYIAPCDLEIEGVEIKKGTWMLGTFVNDDGAWAAVKDGRLTGYSVECFGRRIPIKEGN